MFAMSFCRLLRNWHLSCAYFIEIKFLLVCLLLLKCYASLCTESQKVTGMRLNVIHTHIQKHRVVMLGGSQQPITWA